MKKLFFVLCVCSFALFTVCHAQSDAPWTVEEIRLVDKPGEIVTILENGMVAIIKEHHTAPVAAVRMYVRAGSIYEVDHLGAGLSHLFEHLLACGATENRTEDESRQLIEEIGAQYNANTSKARTCYYLTVPAEHAITAVNLIADWVTRPTFPQDAFDREWGVVQRELEMGSSDPGRVQWKLLDELRYVVHPAKYPVIGHQVIVQELSREDILDYYNRMYIPDNTVVSVVGDFDAEEMLQVVKKEYADFQRRAKINIVLPQEPDVSAPRKIVKVMPELKGPARLVIGFPTITLQHEDLYALDTLANILGEGKSCRLYRRLRDELQLVLGVSTSSYTPAYASGTFTINCVVKPDNIDAVQEAVWVELERIKNEGVTEEELDRAKTQLKVWHIRSNQTAEAQAGRMGEDYISTGEAHFSDHYVGNMQSVTAEQVKEIAKRYLLAQKELTLIMTPVPLAKSGEKQDEDTEQSDIRKVTLDNGLTILLKRNPAAPLVNCRLYFLGGLIDENDQNNGLTALMASLSVKGTESYTNEEIANYFDGIGGDIGASSGNNTFYYAMETLSEDFADSLDIFAEVVLKPTFPQEELDKLRPQILAYIEQADNSWQSLGQIYFRNQFFVNSPYKRVRTGTIDSMSSLTREQVVEFYNANVTAERGILAVFGDIDVDATENMLREKFSALPQGKSIDLTKFAAEPKQTEDRFFIKETPKPGAVVFVGYPGMTLNDKDQDAMEVMSQIVGSNTGWLHETLRGRQLVYYAWLFSFSPLTEGFVGATAQCEAEKVDEVIAAIREQIDKAARGEFTAEEVARAKSKRIGAEILGKQTNSDAAASAALDEIYGFGYDYSQSQAQRIGALTLADIQAVAAKYLTGPITVAVVTSQPDKVSKP